jgi:hypothetical protein
MNKIHYGKRALPWLAATAFLLAAPAFAAADCNNPQGTPQARACAVAKQGNTDLRRFIERTTSIYQLAYADFANPSSDVAKVEEPVKVASNETGRN